MVECLTTTNQADKGIGGLASFSRLYFIALCNRCAISPLYQNPTVIPTASSLQKTPMLNRSVLLYPALCLVVLTLAGVKRTPKTYHVYFLGGQSNMDGYGYVCGLPEALQGTVPDVMIFHGNTSPDNAEVDGRGLWTTLRPGPW